MIEDLSGKNLLFFWKSSNHAKAGDKRAFAGVISYPFLSYQRINSPPISVWKNGYKLLVERILLVTNFSRNRERCRKLSLWKRCNIPPQINNLLIIPDLGGHPLTPGIWYSGEGNCMTYNLQSWGILCHSIYFFSNTYIKKTKDEKK